MKRQYQILCVDDDEAFVKSLASSVPSKVAPLCEEFDCCFEFVTSVEELHEVIQSPGAPELALLVSDQMMVGITGVDLIDRIKAQHPRTMCVLLTGHVAPDSVKYAINRHLLDQHVSKPIEDMDAFASMLANLLKQYHVNREENERTGQLALAVTELRKSNANISRMLTTAKNIAALASDLRSLDCDEIIALGARGAVAVFNAQKCIFCQACAGSGQDAGRAAPCPGMDSVRGDSAGSARDKVIIVPQGAAAVCAKLGWAPAIMIPLRATRTSKDGGGSMHGYLCLCGVDPAVMASSELLDYSTSLIRDILSTSLANARLYERVKNDSEMDYLTGTRSRRVFDAMLEAEYHRSVRYDHAFCVMILDVDHFKRINDEHGHSTGDKVLCGVVDVLQAELRASDVLARYGGDEFAVLMPQTDLRGAMDVAERMRKTVASSLAVGGRPITVSCGVAEWVGMRDEAVAGVIRRADAALYQAKRSGRNRVETVGVA